MIAKALELLLKWAWPEAPKWLVPLLLDLLPEVVALVKAIKDADKDIPTTVALAKARAVLDDGLDRAPYWSDLTEEQRDEVLDALLVLFGFVSRVGAISEQPAKRTMRDLRKGLREARKAAGG